MTRVPSLWVSVSAARALAWVFAVLLIAPIVNAALKGNLTAPGWWILLVAASGGVAAVAAMTVPSITHKPRVRDSLMVAGAILTTTIVLALDSPLYEPSMFALGNALCATLIVFGRLKIGFAVGAARLIVRGAIMLSIDPSTGLVGVVDLYSIASLVLALVWLHFLRSIVAAENRFRVQDRQATADLRGRARELAQFQLREALATTGALRALEQITQAQTIEPDLRRAVRVAEAGLRDYIRDSPFEHPLLTPEIAAARRRGVNVVVLGERPEGAHALHDELAIALATVLWDTEAGDHVTISRIPEVSGEAAVSSLVSAPEHRFELRLFSVDGVLQKLIGSEQNR